MQTVIFTKVSGRTEWLMVRAHFVIPKVVSTKVTGNRTSSMERALSTGTTTKSNTKVILIMVKKRDKELSRVMAALTKVNSWTVCSMVRASTILPIQVKSTKDSLKKTNRVAWAR